MAIRAPACLLIGETGKGKTYSLASMHRGMRDIYGDDAKLMYLYTEPGGEESLLDGLKDYEVPVKGVHWHYVAPVSPGWDTLLALEEKMSSFSYEFIASMKQGIDKENCRQLYELISTLGDFKCERTGKMFGGADTWGQNVAVAFDSVTGLNKICKETAVGVKPTLHQGEWGMAQVAEELFLRKFIADINCPRVVIGHLEKTLVESEGRQVFGLSLIGRKLAERGEIVTMFSDVILSYTEGRNFYWSTRDDRIALKSRNLPLGDKIRPDFAQVLQRWKEREAMAAQQDQEDEDDTE